MGFAKPEFDAWLTRSLAAMGRKTRRRWAPFYLRGLLVQGIARVCGRWRHASGYQATTSSSTSSPARLGTTRHWSELARIADRRVVGAYANKGYDHCRCRCECRARSITPRIARRSMESSEWLGRYRRIVKRNPGLWLALFRRLAIHDQRRADLHLAFTSLACAIIYHTQAKRFCRQL